MSQMSRRGFLRSIGATSLILPFGTLWKPPQWMIVVDPPGPNPWDIPVIRITEAPFDPDLHKVVLYPFRRGLLSKSELIKRYARPILPKGVK